MTRPKVKLPACRLVGTAEKLQATKLGIAVLEIRDFGGGAAVYQRVGE
jgi:hypothetical protein